jgi:hypothetical protein
MFDFGDVGESRVPFPFRSGKGGAERGDILRFRRGIFIRRQFGQRRLLVHAFQQIRTP